MLAAIPSLATINRLSYDWLEQNPLQNFHSLLAIVRLSGRFRLFMYYMAMLHPPLLLPGILCLLKSKLFFKDYF